MIIKLGADFVPMVFLTEDTVQNSAAADSEETTQVAVPLLAKPVFIGGFSVGIFIAGGILGLLLAKMQIKKEIELYEDI